VNPDVHIEGNSLVEGLGAIWTLVLLSIPMDLQVATQISLVVKRLAAFGTLSSKLLGSPMNGQVILVVSQLREALSAIRTLVSRRFMRLFVSLKKEMQINYLYLNIEMKYF